MSSVAEEIRVPADLSGFFCVIPLQLSRKVDGTGLVIIENLRVWLLLMVSYLVQFLFMYEIAELDESRKYEVHSELWLLNYVCVFVFMVKIFEELRACKDLLLVIIQCPSKSDHGYGAMQQSDLADTHGAIL